MNFYLDWILENKEWIFSGVGIFGLTFLYKFFQKKKRDIATLNNSSQNLSTNKVINPIVQGDSNTIVMHLRQSRRLEIA